MNRYFNVHEIICHCGCRRGEDIVNPILLERLDKLRELYGHPIHVECMYRCPEHNYAVDGVGNSQHVAGNAADIWVDGDYEEFYELVINSSLFDGVGHYPDGEFVHVDVRSDGAEPNEYWWCG